ncbi:rubrerythrin family protein [Dysgonomonas sp. 216]|uniref:rubrerythrin n=1 Tax=Dysgonomonas sp. 216 TaxID=2302934 RepID=UPI0013D5D7CB|nr:ferritin family protein [Dysgonomonas sp. 216]NDW19309.1 rubrerythrin family protein [Dysgonomonas sp. 216]
MEKSVKGTRTEKCLLTSFAGESQAKMRYTFFASVAKKEGYEQIAANFLETADQEKEHAKRMFKFLEGGMVEITASYPAGKIGTTEENLIAAAAGEHEEWAVDYPMFADIAEEEGFKEIATMYRMIAKVEEMHENRYKALLDRIQKDSVFSREEAIDWQCRNCGYVLTGKKAPKTCPACLHPQAFFEPMKWNF